MLAEAHLLSLPCVLKHYKRDNQNRGPRHNYFNAILPVQRPQITYFCIINVKKPPAIPVVFLHSLFLYLFFDHFIIKKLYSNTTF